VSKSLSLKTETSVVVVVVGGGGVGGGRGVVLVVLEEVVRNSFFVGRLVLFSPFLSFSCLWDKVFCCNLFHHGIVVLARGL
jgi:hypothetical protein